MDKIIPKVDVPEGECGDWKVERFTVSEADSQYTRLQQAMKGRGYVPAGDYTWLKYRGSVIMSDTRDERRDHLDAVRKAHGVCLVNGLGLGVVLNAMAIKDAVEKVIVVEISEDVIDLVWEHYKEKFGDKVELVHADALEYKPTKGSRFGVCWHDIWPDICGDNYEDMKNLHRKYGRYTAWQGSWCRAEVERLYKGE